MSSTSGYSGTAANEILILPLTGKQEWYEPASRSRHSTAVVGESCNSCGQETRDKAPHVHDSADKRGFLSREEVFHLQRGSWEYQTTSGTKLTGSEGLCLCSSGQ